MYIFIHEELSSFYSCCTSELNHTYYSQIVT